jgi:hypothetical protein
LGRRESGLDVPSGGDPSALPERQFAWNDALPTGPHGNVKLPNHQLLLFLNYRGDVPTAADRDRVAEAFDAIERGFQYGTGDEYNATSTQGLLTMIGYSPSYFDRFGTRPSAAPPSADSVVRELDEDARVDAYDAALVLTSDEVSVLLAAEQALRGDVDAVNDTELTSVISDIFTVADRRTGFLGVGRPADELETDVPEDAPAAMGYRSGFKDNQATEDRVAIADGPFADGTTMQISRLVFSLDDWYDNSEEARVKRMFSPQHSVEDVGEIGERLGGQSRIEEETVEDATDDARSHGMVGHTQKVAAGRDDEFEPTLLRRSEGVSTDLDQPALNFSSLQQQMTAFLEVRRAMNGDHVDVSVPTDRDGIRDYVSVRSRGTYLVPPRSKRALPIPR